MSNFFDSSTRIGIWACSSYIIKIICSIYASFANLIFIMEFSEKLSDRSAKKPYDNLYFPRKKK